MLDRLCLHCNGTGRVAHECEPRTMSTLRTLLEVRIDPAGRYEVIRILRCSCGQLWKMCYQSDPGTGSDIIWLRPGESERGYSFAHEEAAEYETQAEEGVAIMTDRSMHGTPGKIQPNRPWPPPPASGGSYKVPPGNQPTSKPNVPAPPPPTRQVVREYLLHPDILGRARRQVLALRLPFTSVDALHLCAEAIYTAEREVTRVDAIYAAHERPDPHFIANALADGLLALVTACDMGGWDLESALQRRLGRDR